LSVLQCDVANCGGLTGARKIAALAEAYFIPFAPHNPNGPLATLASGHLLAAIPNAYLLETVGAPDDGALWAELVDDPPVIERGVLTLREKPGLGAAFLPDAPTRHPPLSVTGTR
ncbi:MAG: enolase C-terminal domain-like protein, partial [Fimbriimonadales bacterium]